MTIATIADVDKQLPDQDLPCLDRSVQKQMGIVLFGERVERAVRDKDDKSDVAAHATDDAITAPPASPQASKGANRRHRPS